MLRLLRVDAAWVPCPGTRLFGNRGCSCSLCSLRNTLRLERWSTQKNTTFGGQRGSSRACSIDDPQYRYHVLTRCSATYPHRHRCYRETLLRCPRRPRTAAPATATSASGAALATACRTRLLPPHSSSTVSASTGEIAALPGCWGACPAPSTRVTPPRKVSEQAATAGAARGWMTTPRTAPSP